MHAVRAWCLFAVLYGSIAEDNLEVIEHGVLHQDPPLPYVSGIVALPDDLKLPYFNQWNARSFPGWQTTFWIESLVLQTFDDLIEFRNNTLETEYDSTAFSLNQRSREKVKVDSSLWNYAILIQLNGQPKAQRRIYIRWISTPNATQLQGGFITQEPYRIPQPSTDSLLINVLDTGPNETLYASYGSHHVPLRLGYQLLSNITSDVLLLGAAGNQSGRILLEWFPYRSYGYTHSSTTGQGCISKRRTEGFNTEEDRWTLKVPNQLNDAGIPYVSTTISFYNVTTSSQGFSLAILLNGTLYIAFNGSIEPGDQYTIPVNTSGVDVKVVSQAQYFINFCFTLDTTPSVFYASGRFDSPQYPGPYPLNTVQEHFLSFPPQWQLHLTLFKIQLTESRDWFDLILRTPGQLDKRLKSLTGYHWLGLVIRYQDHITLSYTPPEHPSLAPPVYQSINARFQSGAGLPGATKEVGYYIAWSAVLKGSSQYVDNKVVANSGELSSPGYPHSYSLDLDLSWIIEIQDKEKYNAIYFIFDDSELENDYDHISIVKDRQTPFFVGTGKISGFNLTVQTTTMFVFFQTDGSKSSKGFKFTWQAVVYFPPSTTASAQPGRDLLKPADIALIVTLPILFAVIVALTMKLIKLRKRASDFERQGFYKPRFGLVPPQQKLVKTGHEISITKINELQCHLDEACTDSHHQPDVISTEPRQTNVSKNSDLGPLEDIVGK